MRKHIGFIELTIVLSVVVISVMVWTHYKEKNKSVFTDTCTPIADLTVSPHYDRDSGIACSNCDKSGLIIIGYKDLSHNTQKILQGGVCSLCGWGNFKCPNCGNNTFKFKNELIVECNKCRWNSLTGVASTKY